MRKDCSCRLTAVTAAAIIAFSIIAAPLAFGAESGRIVLPTQSRSETTAMGLQKLNGRIGFLYIPFSSRPNEPLPLLVLLHKAGGTAAEWFPGGNAKAPGS